MIWDYTYYWGVLAQFFFQRRLADLTSLSVLRAELDHCRSLNLEVQALLRDWSAARPLASVPNPATMLDQAALPWFAALNKSLLDRLDDAAFRERIRHGTHLMRQLAAEIAQRAQAQAGVASPALRALLDEPVAVASSTPMPDGPLLFAMPATSDRRGTIEAAAA